MNEYLTKYIGKKVGVIRAGRPKEVYLEGELVSVGETAVVLRFDDGKEAAVALQHIVMAGSPGLAEDEKKTRPGFL
jgi:RNase P/RNase MRP subunit p29